MRKMCMKKGSEEKWCGNKCKYNSSERYFIPVENGRNIFHSRTRRKATFSLVLRTHLITPYLHYLPLPTIYNTSHSIQALASIQNSTVMNYSRNPPVCLPTSVEHNEWFGKSAVWILVECFIRALLINVLFQRKLSTIHSVQSNILCWTINSSVILSPVI